MGAEPAIKASYFAGNVAALSVLGPLEPEARRRLAPIIRELAQRSRVDRVPVGWDVELTHVVAELGGIGKVREVNRRSFLSSLDGPLLRPLFGVAVQRFGMSPRSMVRIAAMAWEAGARNLGTLQVVELREDRAVLQHAGLPDPVLGDIAWAHGTCGIFEGACEFTGYRCIEADITFVDPRTYRCEGRWEKLPPPR